jgi:Bacterial Ig-like domain (group 2)
VSTFQYTPDEEQKVHGAGAIALICKPFQSHENGLPEWAKNAADAYGREGSLPKQRVIVIALCDKRSLGLPSIACLDFVGTTSEKIEKYFRHWADPEAAAQGTDTTVQGGHGNGGKCYMTQMFTDHAAMHTCRDGRGNKYGVKGGTTQFGYVPSPNKGRDYTVKSLNDELESALLSLAMSKDKLPTAARDALSQASGFTLIRGTGPKYFERKIKVKDLVSQIQDHPQMLATLEFCDVYIVYNGSVVSDAAPLRPSIIDPIAGSAEPRTIDIPTTLVDPATGDSHSTTDAGRLPSGQLVLRTSSTSMRWKKKSRHTINYKATGSGFIGYRSMLEFPITSGYRNQIYGECALDAMEDFKQNDRGPLAEAPLTRAVNNFITEQIELYAEEFEAKDRKDYTKKERNELSRINEALDKWKNRIIDSFVGGAFGSGGGPAGGIRLPAGTPAKIDVLVTHPRLGLGVAIRPSIRFFDAAGRQIRPVPYRWVSEDPNVAMVDDDLMLINSFTPGSTVIYAETTDSSLQSTRVPIEVIRIRSIALEPDEVSVKAGGRTQIRALCAMSSGQAADDVALIWTEGDSSVARVSSNGLVFGVSPGTTEVVAGDDKITCDTTTKITVEEGSGSGSGGTGSGGAGSGRGAGSGYPLILVSGDVDQDPDTGDYVHFSPDEPPVMQRPQDTDRNVWWINSVAPLAQMYLSKKADFGYESREWRMYHLERYCDILTQIAAIYDPQLAEQALTAQEFFLYTSDKLAEIQMAIAGELAAFIHDGTIPEE